VLPGADGGGGLAFDFDFVTFFAMSSCQHSSRKYGNMGA
jgi:hypothetical protein